MSHRTIIVESSSLVSDAGTKARVEYHPDHSATPAQIGNEVERIMRKINAIEGGEE